jgi:heptose-I-phosphate ethanolaminephosphotransferase
MFRPDWRNLGLAFLFFWYFSGLTHLMLFGSGATGFEPVRLGLLYSALWLLPLLVFPAHVRPIAAGIGVLLGLGALVNLGYFAIYRQEFSQSVLFIMFETNPAEAREYIGQYFNGWMLPGMLLFLAGAVLLWRRLRPLNMPGAARFWVGAVLLAVLFVPPAQKAARRHDLRMDRYLEELGARMEPALPWTFVVGYFQYRQQLASMTAMREHAERIPPIADLVDARAGKPTTLVLVIGESTNRMHMQLYGYARPTTPRLVAMRDRLTVFEQAYAARPYTIETLQQVLTFADQEHPDLYLSRPSLMNIMKQAGYHTYWITNQQTLTKRNTMLTHFSELMDEQFYLNQQRSQNSYSFDEKVLEPLRKVLQDGAPRRFIVVHLLGTHMRYKYRYPPEAAVFHDGEGLPEWARGERAEMIDEYDNAVHYNDAVVTSIINNLAAAQTPAALVYFSDHGEDVFDTPPHDFDGRNEARPTPAMYAVPFLFWRSPQWLAEDGRDFSGATRRVYSLSHFIHTWADLVGLRFAGFDASLSIINPAFRELPILVGDPANPQGLRDLRRQLSAQP